MDDVKYTERNTCIDDHNYSFHCTFTCSKCSLEKKNFQAFIFNQNCGL